VFDFQNLENKLLSDEFLTGASKYSDYDYIQLQNYIITSLEEAKHTLKLISRYDLHNKNILEFGSGLGIVSLVLYIQGYLITSYEPGGLGFEKNLLINKYMKDFFELDFNLINNLAEIKNNSFDFIFSNNVLEHIDDIENTISALNEGLTRGGLMLHNVPNYIIPYEPHFGILFFPIFPKKMSFLISKKITETGLWKSLNFINTFDIVSYSKKHKVDVVFEKELMYKTIKRIDEDIEFSNRHVGISKIINILKKLGLLNSLRFLPASLNTPMVFEWRKRID